MTSINQDIDPELADDRDVQDEDTEPVELPEYDSSQFDLDDDFEVEVEGEDELGN